MRCDWVEVNMDLRVPPGTPKPTEEQWILAAMILGAVGFTSSDRKYYRVFNRDMEENNA